MGFRFRRTLKILPGLRLNLSRSGVSATAGVRGASVTVGKKGTYANVGLPGSGLSYRTKVGEGIDDVIAPHPHTSEAPPRKSWLPLILASALMIGGGAVAFKALQPKSVTAPPTPAVATMAPAEKIAPRETVRITKKSTAIRAEAARKSDKLGTAHEGDSFTVFAKKGVWLQVGHDTAEGWIAASATN